MKLLNDMDEKLKMIDAFNGQLKEFHGKVVEIETWLPEGRARMDELLSPDNPTSAEDRVVQTMELQVSNTFGLLFLLKFMFSKKATKNYKIFTVVDLTLIY